MPRVSTFLFVILLAAAAPAGLLAQTTITVNTLEDEDNDDGDCSLREALVAADTDAARDACPAGTGADVIEFGVTGSLPVTFLIAVETDVTIEGPGADLLTLDAVGANRLLSVNGGTLTVRGVTLAGGRVIGNSGGGAVVFNSGTLHLADCVVRDNQSEFDGGGVYFEHSDGTIDGCSFINNRAMGGGGGGVLVLDGEVDITNSTFSGNQANQDGGGLWATNPGTRLTIRNTTFSANTANGNAGGLLAANGETVLNNVTLTANTADADADGAGDGGGLVVSTGATATIRNTIIAANLDGSAENSPPHDIADFGTLTSAGFNLIGDGTEAPTLVDGTNNDRVGTGAQPIDPRLGLLDVYDVGTAAHVLIYDSPALDAGSCTDDGGAVVATDQRGVPRPQGAGCDIGAFERRDEDARVAVDDADVPSGFRLSAVYPNPFNPEARLMLSVDRPQRVRVVVFDVWGRQVAVLHDGVLAAGPSHRLALQASDRPSGVYLIRVVGEDFAATRKALLVR